MAFFSAAFNNTQLTKLRGDSNTKPTWAADQVVCLNPNTVIFAARVNGAVSTTTGYASVEFDTVTTGAFGDVMVDQRVLFSATNDIRAAYLDTRVRAALDSNTIPIAETSVDIGNDDYIFVISDFPLIDRLARPLSTTTQAKDYDDTFLRLAPVVKGVQPVYMDNVGSNGELRIVLDASTSYPADHDAASISSYAWSFTEVTETVISGGLTSSAVTVDVTEGHGWGHLTLTDSAGVTWVFHFEIHALGDTYTPVFGFEGAQISGDLENGFTCSVNAFTGVDDVIDNTRITIGRTYEYYNGTDAELVSGINVDFVGWIRNETDNNRSDQQYSYVSDVSFEVIGVAQRLAELEGQALALRDNTAPDEWDEIEQLMPWRAVVHVWQRHSTLLNLFPLDFDSNIKNSAYRFPMIPAIGGNPLAIAKGILDGVNGSLEFSGDGRICINRIGHYLNSIQRSSLPNLINFDTQDHIEFNEQRSQFKRVGRVLSDGAYWDGTIQTVTALRAVAPGHAQGAGADQSPLNNQILTVTAVQSEAQAELNLRAATALAIFNDDGNQAEVVFPDGYHAALIPSYGHTYTFTVSTADNIRGIAYTTSTKWFCVSVNHAHNNGDEQGAGMGSRDVRATFKRLLAIPTPGETIEQIAEGDIAPALPDLPPFPAFDFELPETIFPLAGLTAVDPKLLQPPKNKVAKVDGSTLIMKSTDGTKAFLVTEAIALTYPKMRDITPTDLGSYTIRAVLFDPLNKADSAGNKYAYILASDGTDSKVWSTSNVFALPKPTWTASAALTGVYTVLRGNNAAGSIEIYKPIGNSTGTATITMTNGTVSDTTPAFGDDFTVTTVFNPLFGGFHEFDLSLDDCYDVMWVSGSITARTQDFQAMNIWDCGSNPLSVSAAFNDPAGIAAMNSHIGETHSADLMNCDTGSATTFTFRIIGVHDATNATILTSIDFGETWSSAVTVGTSPGTVGGFDTQKAGTVQYAAADEQVRIATTLGGAFANANGGALSDQPVTLMQPYYVWGSASSKNTTGATPDYLAITNGAGSSVKRITGAGVVTDITPVAGFSGYTPNGATSQYGTHLAVLGMVSGAQKVYSTINAGSATPTWILVASPSGCNWIRTRRGDTRASAGGQKGQLYILAGTTLYYSVNWGQTVGTRTLSVACDSADILG